MNNTFSEFDYVEKANNSRSTRGGGGYFFSGIFGAIIGATISSLIIFNSIGYFSSNGNMANGVKSIEIVNQEESPVIAIAEKVGPSAVGIRVVYSVAAPSLFYGIITQEAEGVGSGIIVRKDGYILTNYHVIENAYSKQHNKQTAKVEVYLPNNDTPVDARIVGGNEEKDIAVLKIEKDDLIEVEMGDSDKVKVGELAVAIGNPLGLEFAGSVTSGVVSAVNREIKVSENTTMTLIQTDAAINSGNSGGALVNSSGQVIGINSAKIAGTGVEGIGFAIPINDVKQLMDELIEDYVPEVEKPQIGIGGTDVDETTSKAYNIPVGVYVGKVYEDSGADKAGIKVKDVVIKFDGVDIKTMDELNAQKEKHQIGDTVPITIIRDGKEIELNITLTKPSY